MPESKKVTLQQQLETEVASILALRPDLLRIHLADGAKDNWRLLNELETRMPKPAQPPIEILDFYHACDHLKNACDAAWGESTAEGKAQFERLKTLLKEAEDGAERVIGSLRYQRDRARANKRKRLQAQLTYFRNQRHRMLSGPRIWIPAASRPATARHGSRGKPTRWTCSSPIPKRWRRD